MNNYLIGFSGGKILLISNNMNINKIKKKHVMTS
jgi:hypothetical protein